MTTDMRVNRVVSQAGAQRAALEARGAQVMARLVAAYGELWRRLQDRAELLGYDIAGLASPSAAQVARLARYRTLLAAVADELDRYSAFAAVEVNAAAVAAIGQAGADTAALVSAAGVSEGFATLPTDTIRALLAFLNPDGPLFERLAQLGPRAAQQVADAIVENVARGLNPAQWAGVIRDALGGGLTDALRTARTVQLYSYREASRANYAANPSVVQGWYWFAQLDRDTCLSCVAQHGTLHEVSETLNDHHNGRCAMIPDVVGFDNPLAGATGQAWFEQLPAATQAEMMGPGKYAAWQDGQFEFSALSAVRQDDVYGAMRVEETLQALLGA